MSKFSLAVGLVGGLLSLSSAAIATKAEQPEGGEDMNLLGKLFNGKRTEQPEHAVLVYLKLSDDEHGITEEREKIFTLEKTLTKAVERNQAGEFDGNEFGEGFCTLYLYGPDAEKLFQAAFPVLQEFDALHGSYVVKRYGKPGARQERIELH